MVMLIIVLQNKATAEDKVRDLSVRLQQLNHDNEQLKDELQQKQHIVPVAIEKVQARRRKVIGQAQFG